MDQHSNREPDGRPQQQGQQPGSPPPTDPLPLPEQPLPEHLAHQGPAAQPETPREQPSVAQPPQEPPVWPELPPLSQYGGHGQQGPYAPTASSEGAQQPGYPASPFNQAQASPQYPQHPQHPQYSQPPYPQQPPTEGAGTVQFGQPEQSLLHAQPLPGGEATRAMPPAEPLTPNMPPYPALPETRRRGWPAWAWVVMGVVLTICLTCVGIGVLGGNVVGGFVRLIGEPAAVATDYWVALQTHDFERAHKHLSSDLVRGYSAEDLEADWRALEDVGDVTGSRYESINVENDRATVEWVVTAGGESYRTTLRLRNTGGEWKITGGDPGVVPRP